MTATLPVRSALACVLSLFTCSLLAAQEGPRLPPSPDVPETETETAVAEAAQLTPPTSVRYAYASDWRQAGPGEGQLGSRLRSHIVRLDADGILTGRLTVIGPAGGRLLPIERVRVRFIRSGEVMATTLPLADGSFSVSGLKPGVYAVVAAGEQGFLACSVNLRPPVEDLAGLPETLRHAVMQQATDSLDIEAAAVPPASFKPLKHLMRTYLPQGDAELYPDGVAIPDGMSQEPPLDAAPATSLKYHQVQLTPDGRLLGRIRRLEPESGRALRIRQLNVYLLKQDRIVAQEPVQPEGLFAFRDVTAGVYSVVAAGRDGFVAFSVEVLGGVQNRDGAVNPGTQTTRFKPMQDASLTIDVALVSPEDLNQQNVGPHTDDFPFDRSAIAQAPVSGGAPGQMATGGGGVGGGGPPIGEILIGAGGVVVGTLIDGDGDRRVSSPASIGSAGSGTAGGGAGQRTP